MEGRLLRFDDIRQATVAIDEVGSGNSAFMATRAVYMNVLIRNVPGEKARSLKRVYNDIGAEVAISSDAYQEREGAVTDLIVMGALYHHREARRILAGHSETLPLVHLIESITENAPEIV
ncbi:MAG: hypothetical protein FJ118_04795 [Deltaproteobacteria bacterium]|nr:hypothetical protein [Deltaproteobacteria bacterium]